jgi:small subunit ribosomal protein S18
VDTLRHYLTDTGKIRPRRQTSACAKCQRALAVAIKRARHLALLPYAPQHSRRR